MYGKTNGMVLSNGRRTLVLVILSWWCLPHGFLDAYSRQVTSPLTIRIYDRGTISNGRSVFMIEER